MYVYRSIQEMRAAKSGSLKPYELKETKAKSYIALHPLVAHKQRQVIDVGGHVYRMLELEPGKHYEIPDESVLAFILEKFKEKRRYSAELKKTLEDGKVVFKETVCRTCGGRGRFLEYQTVVVVHGSNKRKRQTDDTPKDSEE